MGLSVFQDNFTLILLKHNQRCASVFRFATARGRWYGENTAWRASYTSAPRTQEL